jgi:hypothetical protein
MDRRYLIATLALVATFAVCSHEMRGGRLVVLASQRLGAIAGRCGGVSSAPARIVSEMRARVLPTHPEEAQMLAEMNLPMLRIQAKSAAIAASEQAKCERETALRAAELARRDAQRAREDARRMRTNVGVAVPNDLPQPIVLNLKQLPQISERIQIKTNGLQRTVEIRGLRLTADQLGRINTAVEVATASINWTDFAPVVTGDASASVRCRAQRSFSQQMQLRYGNAMRHTLQSLHNSLNVTNIHQGTGSSL